MLVFLLFAGLLCLIPIAFYVITKKKVPIWCGVLTFVGVVFIFIGKSMVPDKIKRETPSPNYENAATVPTETPSTEKRGAVGSWKVCTNCPGKNCSKCFGRGYYYGLDREYRP
jgi:hypothetical protein